MEVAVFFGDSNIKRSTSKHKSSTKEKQVMIKVVVKLRGYVTIHKTTFNALKTQKYAKAGVDRM